MTYIATWCTYDQINQELTAHADNGWRLHTAALNDREARWYLIFERTL